LIFASSYRSGKSILNRYKLITEMLKGNEAAHFEFARYLETLYHDAKAQEDAAAAASLAASASMAAAELAQMGEATSNAPMRRGEGTSSSINGGSSAHEQSGASEAVPASHDHLYQALRQYGVCINTVGRTLHLQAMPRMLTLFLSFTALTSPPRPGSGGSSRERSNSSKSDATSGNSNSNTTGSNNPNNAPGANQSVAGVASVVGRGSGDVGGNKELKRKSSQREGGPTQLQRSQHDVCELMMRFRRILSVQVWYTCMPQLVSRTGANCRCVE
jgi:hypothetical protein